MVLTEVWVELKTDDGRVYFWNRQDNSRAWTLPEGQEVKWIGEKSPDGRTYYWSRKSKETVWVLPPLEPEKSEKKEETEASPPQKKGALASLLRGEPQEKEASPEELKQQQQALQEALLNSLPGDESGKPEPKAATREASPESPAREAKEPEQAAEQAQAAQATAAASAATAAASAASFPGVNPMGTMGPMGMGAMDPMQAMMMAQMGMAPSLPGLMMPGLGGLPMPGMMPGMPGVMPGMPGMPGSTMPGMPSMPMGMGGMPGVPQSQPATAPPATMPPTAPPAPVAPVATQVAPPAPTVPPTAPVMAPCTLPATAPAVPAGGLAPAPPPAPPPLSAPVQETYEEHPYLEEEQEPSYCAPPEGLPGPKGDSASAIAARHVIEAAGVDTWFLKLPGGEWEEVVRFWPPPDDLDVARPPKLKKKPRMDKWKSRSLAMRCQRHEEVVRAMLVAQYSTARSFSVEKYPCPLSTEWCFWGSDGRQITCEEPDAEDGPKIPANFERNPPEGQRCKLMQNKTRSQLSMVFKATKLRHLERALAARQRRSQQLLQDVGSSVPQVLKAAAKRLGKTAEEPMVKAMPRPKATVQEPPADPPAGVASPVSPPKAEEPSSEAAPWKKRRVRGERPAAAPVPERPAPGTVPAPVAAPVVEMAEESLPNVKELLPRKVLLSNVPQNATVKELSDFFTGAIFTATGLTLSENVKVVELVELQGNGHAEVLFATTLSATIAVALHGMNFQNKLLGIRRPPGYSGPTLNRAKLLTVAMKDLVSEDLPEAPGTAAVPPVPVVPAAGPSGSTVASASGPSGVVKITGIPASMNGTSVFDCLQQFGGPLKSLSLTTNRETGEHNGSGTAEFVEHASAVEACRFSPFFGFIEVTMQEPPAAKTEIEAPLGRRSRWSQQDDIDDLGPFNEVLPPKPSASLARATSKARPQPPAATPDDLDLGPFADLLPPAPAGADDDLDLGPFNDILRKASGQPPEDDLDLGPFAAILPPRS